MRTRALGAACAVVATVAASAPTLAGQGHPHARAPRGDSAAAAFLAAARAGTERYRELAAAIADGYRRIGGDLPSLGEHWVNTGLVARDSLVPAAPPLLIYARVGGAPVLAGVAYTRLLAPDEPYPAFPTAAPDAWHEHNGSVAEETLPLGHAAGGRTAVGRIRVAVLHAWVWLDNPAGVWAADNWALPYARLALRAAARPGADARALALLAGGDAYYANAIAEVGQPDAGETERIRATVARARERTAAKALGLRRGEAPDTAAAAELGALWIAMWDEISRGVRPEVAMRLRRLRDALGSED